MTDTETKKQMTPREASDARPTSAQLCINAFCFECMGGEEPKAQPRVIKAMVRDCPSTRCALWKKRPWRDVTTRSRKDINAR